jgi:hypothetical protein
MLSSTISNVDSKRGTYFRSPYGLIILWAVSVVVCHQFFELYGISYSDSDNSKSRHLNLPQHHPYQLHHPILDLKRGKAVALPSVRVEEEIRKTSQDKYYGGRGDKQHLGGFASGSVDMNGVSPAAWKLMLTEHGIKSLLDVGCGRGVSTSWFHMHGVDTQCVEGSHDAWEQSLVPNNIRIEHDFSRG